jgi:hypothetical protein
LNIYDNDGCKALYGPHGWHFIGAALREVILPEDDHKILVNGELVWDDIGFREGWIVGACGAIQSSWRFRGRWCKVFDLWIEAESW